MEKIPIQNWGLRLHRVRAGLSRETLAVRIDRSASFIQTIENGTHRGPVPDLDWRRIAEVLGVDRADIDK